jgi:hypothetical protein
MVQAGIHQTLNESSIRQPAPVGVQAADQAELFGMCD